MADIHVGIIGVGGIASDRHLPVLSTTEGVKISALCDTDPARLTTAASAYDVQRTYAQADELIAAGGLDAVVVCVSGQWNYQVTRACLAAGLHTLLEKPPGLTVAETEDLARVAAEAGIIAMVGLNRRFRATVNRALATVREGGSIRVVRTDFHSENYAAKRRKGKQSDLILRNYVVSNSIHAIDLLRYLAGGEPATVAATALEAVESGYIDAANALVRFDNGVVGIVGSHYFVGTGERAEVWGDGTACILDGGGHRRLTIYRDGELPVSTEESGELPEWGGTRAQDTAFIETIRAGGVVTRPACSLDDAVGTMRLVEAITTARGQAGVKVTG